VRFQHNARPNSDQVVSSWNTYTGGLVLKKVVNSQDHPAANPEISRQPWKSPSHLEKNLKSGFQRWDIDLE